MPFPKVSEDRVILFKNGKDATVSNSPSRFTHIGFRAVEVPWSDIAI